MRCSMCGNMCGRHNAELMSDASGPVLETKPWAASVHVSQEALDHSVSLPSPYNFSK